MRDRDKGGQARAVGTGTTDGGATRDRAAAGAGAGAGDAVAVRPARPDDLDAVAALDARATGVAKPDYWRAVFAVYVTGAPGRVAFAAERGGTVVGYCLGEVRSWEFGSPPCGWVFALNVAPGLREGGVGTRLFGAACDAFRAAGVASVRTMVARDAGLLLSFFRAQGMTAGPFVQLEAPLAPAAADGTQTES